MTASEKPPTKYQREALEHFDESGEWGGFEVDGPMFLRFHAADRVIESVIQRGRWADGAITAAGRAALKETTHGT